MSDADDDLLLCDEEPEAAVRSIAKTSELVTFGKFEKAISKAQRTDHRLQQDGAFSVISICIQPISKITSTPLSINEQMLPYKTMHSSSSLKIDLKSNIQV